MTDSKKTILQASDISIVFGGLTAVSNFSCELKDGELIGLIGPNGAGKTTTIRVLCGLLLASEGRVLIDGEEFVAGKENLIKQKVGYMSQRFTLYDDISIKEKYREKIYKYSDVPLQDILEVHESVF